MCGIKCETCLKFIHPVKKCEGPFYPYCYWCHSYLTEVREEVLFHVFKCHDHPLKNNQKFLSALEWGNLRWHCSIYQKIQDHLDGKKPYSFPTVTVDAVVQTDSYDAQAISNASVQAELTPNKLESIDSESEYESEEEEEIPIPIPVEHIPDVPDVPGVGDCSTLSLKFPSVEIKMSVGKTGKCTTCFEGLEFELY